MTTFDKRLKHHQASVRSLDGVETVATVRFSEILAEQWNRAMQGSAPCGLR